MTRQKLPLGLAAVAVLVLVTGELDWWMRLGVSGLLVGSAVAIFMRRIGLSWRGLLGGFGRDR